MIFCIVGASISNLVSGNWVRSNNLVSSVQISLYIEWLFLMYSVLAMSELRPLMYNTASIGCSITPTLPHA